MREFNIEDIINVENVGQRDINVVLAQNRIEDVIDNIFEQSYEIRDRDYRVNENHDSGFYIVLSDVSDSIFKSMHPIFRLHYLCENKVKKIMLGDTNNSDSQDKEGWSRLFVLESMYYIFNSKRNSSLEDELKINSIDDIKNILSDNQKSTKLANYILGEVENKARELTRNSSNPDYSWDSKEKKYVAIKYLYLDKSIKTDSKEDIDTYELIEDKSYNEYSYSKLTKYIISNYFKYCTKKQKEFIGAYILYGVCPSGDICNLNNEIIYTKQQVNQFKNQIKKRLEKLIDDDLEIKLNKNNRWVLEDEEE